MWSINKIWNDSLALGRTEREVKPRDYIYASEIGKPYLDRFYAMKGISPTNKFDVRTLRVFEAGNLFEWVVKRVLARAGILHNAQKPVKIQPKGCLSVHGRMDFIAGGKPDYERAMLELQSEQYLPQRLVEIAKATVEQFQKDYPEGLESKIIEVKSVHSMAFWAHIDQLKNAYLHHRLQLFSYIESEQLDGKVFYISKDDLCLEEVDIYKEDAALKMIWLKDIELMTDIYKSDKEPGKEQDLVFDEQKKEWSPNWRIARSSYLTRITGFTTKEEWEEYAEKQARKANRELKAQAELDYYRRTYKNEFRKAQKVGDKEKEEE